MLVQFTIRLRFLAGFVFNGAECSNINECLAGDFECPVNSVCADTEGGYSCSCNFGYKKSGTACEEVNECQLGNKCSQV